MPTSNKYDVFVCTDSNAPRLVQSGLQHTPAMHLADKMFTDANKQISVVIMDKRANPVYTRDAIKSQEKNIN